MLIDTHSHLYFKHFNSDADEVLSRAVGAGVERQILIGCSVAESDRAIAFCRNHKDFDLYCSIGVHPHDAKELNDNILRKFEMMVDEEDKIVAIGEIGLDYFRNLSPREMQMDAFEKQLHLAKKLNLPVIIHERDAWEDTIAILGRVGNEKVVFHSFTGDGVRALDCMERGYHVSFSGMVTYPKNFHMREAVKKAWANRYFVETDCPYLPPQVFRGQRNEPSFVVETAKEVARVRGESFEEVASQSTSNAIMFFGLN